MSRATSARRKPWQKRMFWGHAACSWLTLVNIRFTSSLTPEDESAIAPAILKAMTAILDLFPVAYALRIDTSDGEVFQHAGSESRGLSAAARPKGSLGVAASGITTASAET